MVTRIHEPPPKKPGKKPAGLGQTPSRLMNCKRPKFEARQATRRPTGSRSPQPTRSTKANSPADAPANGAPSNAKSELELRALLEDCVARANKGDKRALAELRSLLDSRPEIWTTVGNLAANTERAWLELLSQDVLGNESVKRHVEEIRAELEGPNPLPMEKLLVNQVVVCYLAAHHADLVAANTEPASIAQLKLRLKRCDVTKRQYLAALRTLALLRAKLRQGMVPTSPFRLYGEPKDRKLA
jgi:hypothetical protein